MGKGIRGLLGLLVVLTLVACPRSTRLEIASFTASPAVITAGEQSTLAWLVTGTPPPTLAIDQGIGSVTGTSVTVSPSATTTYTLTATNAAGSRNRRVTVTVEEPSHGTGSAVLAPGTTVLDDTALAMIERVTQDRLVFADMPPILQDVAAGDVLLLGLSPLTPLGALLVVEGVVLQAEGLELATRPAALEEAFEELRLSVETTLYAPDLATQQGGITFPLHLSEAGAHGRVDLTGSLSLAPSVDLVLDLNLIAFQLNELSLSFSASETFLATLVGQGSVSFEESVTLGTIHFTPIVLILPTPYGPIPIIITPVASIEVGFKGSIQGDFEATVTQQASFTAGLGYRDGSFGGFSDSDSNFNFDQPQYQGAASIKALAGPRLEVLIYNLVGPYATAQAYVELAASAEGPPPCARGVANAGLTAKAGMEFLVTYETTLFNKAYELASFDSCSNDPNAPRPAITWSHSYGRAGSDGERVKAVIELSDGTYLVVGDSNRFGTIQSFAASMWAMRLDALGNILWQRAYERRGGQGLVQGAQEVPGGILVAGTTSVLKLDSGGNLLWARSYDGGEYLEIASIAAHDDGSSILAGRYGNVPQAWAMKLDASGQVLWSRRYGGSDFARVRMTNDGGYILAGKTGSNANDMYLVKLDASGNLSWARALDNRYDSTGDEGTPLSSTDRALDVVEKPSGGYIVVGESIGSFPIPEPGQPGFYAAWVADLDHEGRFAGAGSTVYRAPADAIYSSAYAVAVRPNGSTIVVGRRADTVNDLLENEDVLIIQGGAFSTLGGPGNDAVHVGVSAGQAMPLELTQDGGAILAATSNSFVGQNQYWLIKLNRTASINFPYRANIAGASYINEHAVSAQAFPSSLNTPLTVTTFTSEARFETTAVVELRQAP